MPLRSKPIYIIGPDHEYHHGYGCVPYFYKEELKDMGVE